MKPIIQIALDFVDLKRALRLAKEAVSGGADWLEAGTPLIKSAGLDSVRELKKQFPDRTIVADMKTVDAGRFEVEMAAKAGADVVVVLSSASDSTIKECVEAAANYGVKIMVDFIEMGTAVKRVRQIEQAGADYIGIHNAIDEQMKGKKFINDVKKLASLTSLPLAVAGGINSENALEVYNAGASIIIIGGAVTKAVDAKKAVQEIKNVISKRIKLRTELFRRISENEDILKTLQKVSTANISDALHRHKALNGIMIIPGMKDIKMAGPAFTVRTYPGDWAKPVEAIDKAKKGSVLVIDAGGTGPAVWGELATTSAVQKGIAGVVIDGAIRDTCDIAKMKFPAFAKLITPMAGEPKGFGEMGVPVNISGSRIYPGDWIVGDNDGVIVIQKDKIVETVNRAMDVLERENRIRKEIEGGSSLGKVTELLKWEKK